MKNGNENICTFQSSDVSFVRIKVRQDTVTKAFNATRNDVTIYDFDRTIGLRLCIRWESSMLDLYERLRVYICIYKHVIEQAKVWGGSWRSIRRFSRVCNLRDNRLAVNPFKGPNCSFTRIYVIYTLRFTKKSELVGAWVLGQNWIRGWLP